MLPDDFDKKRQQALSSLSLSPLHSSNNAVAKMYKTCIAVLAKTLSSCQFLRLLRMAYKQVTTSSHHNIKVRVLKMNIVCLDCAVLRQCRNTGNSSLDTECRNTEDDDTETPALLKKH